VSRTSSDGRRDLHSARGRGARDHTARRRGAAVVLGLVAALGLSACGGGDPVESGAAAVVGSDRISVADLQTAYTELNEAFKGPGNQPIPQTSLLSWMMYSPFVIPEAAKQGVAISDDDARDLLDQLRARSRQAQPSPTDSPSGATPSPSTPTPSVLPGDYSDATILAVRSYFSSQRIAEKLQKRDPIIAWWTGVLNQLEAGNPRVSPRYGAYQRPNVATATSPEQLFDLIGTPTPPWFADAAAAAELSPSPGATPEATPGESPAAGTEEAPAEPTPTTAP
jgi:hypothetical protein